MKAPVPDAVTVFRSRSRQECVERAVVLLAMGIGHGIVESGGEHALVVAGRDVPAAERQIELYERENVGWPPRRAEPLPRVGSGWIGAGAYVAVLLLVTALDRSRALGLAWHWAGRVHVELIHDGEWWRNATSLTLHVDTEHLVVNLFFGVLFGLFVGQLLGSGLAWASILVAGTVGNAINALVQPPYHVAVGASTAVFAALGILSAYAWRRRRHTPERWAFRWGPIVGGIVLLALTGTGGERTDVVAHLTGFLCGCGLGAFYGSFGGDLRPRRRVQAEFGAIAVGLLALAWTLALWTNG